jgi:hypothetical protein
MGGEMTSYSQDVIARAMNALKWKPENWAQLKARLEYERTHPPEATHLPGFITNLSPVYTEDEILAGMIKTGITSATAGAVLARIRKAVMKGKEPHVKELTDTDTVTAKELSDAEQRLRPLGYPSTVFPVKAILEDVLAHREPQYPSGTVWKDTAGIVWERLPDGMWLKMGAEGRYSYNSPERPLRRMDVT